MIAEKGIFDALIVHGAGVEGDKPGFGGKMRTIAAAEAYRLGLTSILIFCGGKTAKGSPLSEAEVMSAFAERKYQDQNPKSKFSKIPKEVIILEEDSLDTSSNFENISKLVREKGWNRLGILTNDFHLQRAVKLAHNFGLEVKECSAEKLLIQRSPHFIPLINKLYRSFGMIKTKIIEKVMTLMLIVDPKAQIPRLIASHTRG